MTTNHETDSPATQGENSDLPQLHLHDLNPLLYSHPADTMAHIRGVLTVMSCIECEDGVPHGFNGGLQDLFYLLENTLKMHARYGDRVPDDVVLHEAEWQRGAS